VRFGKTPGEGLVIGLTRNLLAAFRRHPFALGLGLLAVLGVGAAVGGRHLWAWHHYRAAQEALEQPRLAQARAHLALCLEVWPASAPTHLLAARTARRAGAFTDADQLLRRCEVLHADREAVELERALASAQRGDLGAVEASLLSRLKQQTADIPLILEALAQGYLETYRLPEALDCLEQLLRRQPGHVQALLWRALVWERLLYWQEALDDYRQAVALDPENDNARLHLAIGLIDQGAFQEADRHLDVLRQRQPGNVSVFLCLARCGRALGRVEEARSLLDRLASVDPRNVPALTERGKLALEAGEFDRAERWLRQAVALAPFEYNTNYALYQCLQQQGRQEEAKRYQERVKQVQTDLERLRQITEKIVTAAPHDPALACEAGVILLRTGQEDEGLRWLTAALQLDPRHPATHQALASYYERVGRADLAARHRASASH
jgi:tetratricopeptide (TPR) repeat protein